jgi:hypothetical protein
MTNQDILEQDPTFFDRADEHIHLSNSQIDGVSHGKVSASMMYATTRFNAYVSWSGFDNKADFAEARDATIDYFVEQYRIMLAENLDDYISNFERYRQAPGGTHPDAV